MHQQPDYKKRITPIVLLTNLITFIRVIKMHLNKNNISKQR